MLRLYTLVWFIVCFASQVFGSEVVVLQPYSRLISFTGFTRPGDMLTVSAEIEGKCGAVLVDVGDTIGASGVLAEIDSTFVELDLARNRIAQDQTKRKLSLEKKTVSRFANLINKQSTAQATYDEALLKAELFELTLTELQNEEVRLKEKRKRHTLYGPAGWKVIDRFIDPKEFVSQGQPLFTLGNFNFLVIPFQLTLEELQLLRGMAQKMLYLPDIDTEIEADIHRISPDFDSKTRKIPIELIIADRPGRTPFTFRGGLRAVLRIDGKKEENVYRIRRSALISRFDAHWLQTEEGFRQKVILLGQSADGSDAIIKGEDIKVGQRFLANPESLRK